MGDEKVITTELIELYRDLPCLWDLSSKQYKDINQKRLAWEILVNKWKTIVPNANEASVKKKIDNLKASYKRELKKVKDSKKRTGSAADEVHTPSLWYFDLMTFLDYKKDQRRVIDTLSSDDGDESQVGKKRRHSFSERNKQKIIQTAQEILQQNKTKTNSFGVYVGEQLDSLSTRQRQIAEKLISEVLFLGKTDNLNIDSKIESHNNRHRSTFHSHDSSRFPSPQYIIPSPEYTSSSPQYIRPLLQYNIPSPQYNTPSPQYNITSPQHNTPSPQYNIPSPQYKTHQEAIESPSSPIEARTDQSLPIQLNSDQFPSHHQTQTTGTPIIVKPTKEISQNVIESPAGMLLKELLISSSKSNKK